MNYKTIITDEYDRVLCFSKKVKEVDEGAPAFVAGEPHVYDTQCDPAIKVDQANLISSKTVTGAHRPVLDIDFPARLLPSKTPGHFHLYLDGLLLAPYAYGKLLKALREANVIQPGFHKQFTEGGQTQVRIPKETSVVEEPFVDD